MSVKPFYLWLFTLCAVSVALVYFPAQRIGFALAIIAHVPLLILGIFDMRYQFFCKAFIRPRQKGKKIAITFDDGPDKSLTPDILDMLKQHGMHATFFVVAQKAKQHPEIIKRIISEGHIIASHDLAHSNASNFRFKKALNRDIGESQRIIQEIAGKKPLLYRPPVGLTNPHLEGALKKLGMHCIGWSKRPGDAANRKKGAIETIPALASPGEVILLHDALPKPELKQTILNSIDAFCERIKDSGLSAVTVDDMFQIEAYQ